MTPEMIYDWRGPLKQRQNAAWALTLIRQHGRAEAKRIIRKEHRDPKAVFGVLDSIVSNIVMPMPSTAEVTAQYRRSFEAQLFGIESSPTDLIEEDAEVTTIDA